MVLILANREDPCGVWTEQVLRGRGRQVLFLDEDDMIARLQLSWSSTLAPEHSLLQYDNCQVRFNELTGVLARTWNVWVKDPEMTEKDQLYASFEIQAALSGILSSLPCRVVNRPVLGMSYSPLFSHRKTYLTASDAGFAMPRTLVASNTETALRFYQECGQFAVMGSPSNLLPRRRLRGSAGEDELRQVPDNRSVYLQAIPEGRWVHATVVGDQVFASESPWNDGVGEEELSDVSLPSRVEEMACRLASGVGLDLAELQLLIGQDGVAYCYDLNPYPRYWHCRAERRAEITEAVAELLETN